jgi:hypothetical protein
MESLLLARIGDLTNRPRVHVVNRLMKSHW